MNCNYPTTIWESIFVQMYNFLVEQYIFPIFAYKCFKVQSSFLFSVPCTCPPISQLHKNSTQVSFTATLSLAKTSLTTTTDLPFDSDVSNIGNSYNATVSQFTAPVSGLYGFSLTVFMNPGSWVGMHLVKNGHSVLKVRTGHYLYRSTNRSVNLLVICRSASLSVCLLVCPSMKMYSEPL